MKLWCAPNKLKQITIYKAGAGEELLKEYNDFSDNMNVFNVEYRLDNITSAMTIRIKAEDLRGNVTSKDLMIKNKLLI